MSTTLSPEQLGALLDILSHRETYHEIAQFTHPGQQDSYGPPFSRDPGKPSNSPCLQPLLSKFVLTAPGLKDVEPAYWELRFATILRGLQDAELSESYDKGVVGIRRTVSCAMSALFEYPMRGIYAGFNPPAPDVKDREYDLQSADDIATAFQDFMRQAVYGDIVDKCFAKVAETAVLTDHEPLVQATHEFGLINLASFMHYTLILSPKGQSLLTLVDRVHRLIPYALVKQTLKIGNVATMISAMLKIVLAKVSVSVVTNWIGLTQGANEGMNLLQQIMSSVLYWDIRDFRSRASKLEKSPNAPPKDILATLKSYATMPRNDHLTLRQESLTTEKSIVQAILEKSSKTTTLTPAQHAIALEYLSAQLSINDREGIINVFCHSTPDHLTQAVRDVVAAYEPMIRSVHKAVDLSESLGDFEVFLTDLIKLAKLPSNSTASALRKAATTSTAAPPPTVGDFVLLLRKHQGSLHKFLHSLAKNGPEVMAKFRVYANDAVAQFRQHDPASSGSGAGDLSPALTTLFTALPSQQQEEFLPILSAHAAYIDTLHAASAVRLRAVLASPPSRSASPTRSSAASHLRKSPWANAAALKARATNKRHTADDASSNGDTASTTEPGIPPPGPGAFLARWQALLDATPITPANATGGPVRHGGSGSVLRASAAAPDEGFGIGDENTPSEGVDSLKKESEKTVQMQEDSDEEMFEEAHEMLAETGLEEDEKVDPPDGSAIYEALCVGFRDLLAERSCYW